MFGGVKRWGDKKVFLQVCFKNCYRDGDQVLGLKVEQEEVLYVVSNFQMYIFKEKKWSFILVCRNLQFFWFFFCCRLSV